MTVDTFRVLLRELNDRRKALKMSLDVLARRSGLSRATVCRILRGDGTAASFLNVAAVAQALGVELEFRPTEVETFVEKQARRLVGMLQGTMGLEGQGLDGETTDRLVRQSRHRLLSGPRKKLWVE